MVTKKGFCIALVFSIFLFFSASSLMAQTYVSGNLGLVVLNDADVKFKDYGETPAEFTFENGYGILVALGHAYDSGLRSEVEVGYRVNDADKLKWKGEYSAYFEDENVSGDFSSLSFMANGFYDFKTESALTPFLGFGVGLARLDADGEKDNVFAYQAAAGVSYAINTKISLDLQYRYFATSDPEFTIEGEKIESEYSTHNMMLGLRYNF